MVGGTPAAGSLEDRIVGTIAGSLGLLSIFVPWIVTSSEGIYLGQVPLFRVSIGLLILGGIVGLFRTAGGFFLLIAWIWFLTILYASLPAGASLNVGLGAGFYLAVTASIVSLARYALRVATPPRALPVSRPVAQDAPYQPPPPPPSEERNA